MNGRRKLILLISLTLLMGEALATNTPAPTPEKPVATANSNSSARASSHSKSIAESASVSQAQGGDAHSASTASTGAVTNTATSGASSSTSNGGSSAAHNDLTNVTTYERSAPSLYQGNVFVGDCGAGGNAGGSNTNGGGFLGFAWTPADCKLLKAAQAYMALGMPDAACEMVNGIKPVAARWKELGVAPPSCAMRKADVTPAPPPAPVAEKCITASDLQERDRRQSGALGCKDK